MSSPELSNLESMLLQKLEKFAVGKNILVALSGGVDSKALLVACYQLKQRGLIDQLTALHVSHGIHSDSSNWQESCEKDCRQLGIKFLSTSLALGEKVDFVSEQQARESRYQFFESVLKADDCLLFAHHQNDQAETLLFRLIRGTGIRGASAMPVSRDLGKGMLLRPWLYATKESIIDYAESKKLSWIDDPSNDSSEYSRNYLRNQVMPLLKNRWPKFTEAFARFANMAAEQTELLKGIYLSDLSDCQTAEGQLNIRVFNQFSLVRRKNLLHFWSEEEFTLAASSKEIIEAVRQIEIAENKSIAIDFSKGKLRTYSGFIFLTNKNEPRADFEEAVWDDLNLVLKLSNGVSVSAEALETENSNKLGIRVPLGTERVFVRERKGGEICCPHYRDRSNSLKKIYQECLTPVWERPWLPLIYYNEELVAVPGVFVNKSFLAKNDESAVLFKIEKGRV